MKVIFGNVNESHTYEERYIRHFTFFSNQIEDVQDDEYLYIPDHLVNMETGERNYITKEKFDILIDFISNNLDIMNEEFNGKLSEYNKELFSQFNVHQLLNLMNISKFLDCNVITYSIACYLASLIKGKSEDQMREIFARM